MLIMQTALDECRNKSVTLIGEDTDILVLALLHHNIIEHKHPMFLTCEAKANMVSAPDVWNIGETKKVIGEELCEALPLLHVISGCDTTSRIHSVGKPAVIQKFHSNKDFRRLAKTFACRSKPQCDVMAAGEKLTLFLMGATKKEMSMDDKRLANYYKKIAGKNAIKPEGLGPTSDATAQHSLRVYYQVQVWKGNNELNAEEWGWRKTTRGILIPVAAMKPPALQELLKIIRCACLTDCTGRYGCL